MGKSILAVIGGVVAGGVVVWSLQEWVQPMLFGTPSGLPPMDAPREIWAAWLEGVPLGAKLFVVISESLAALVGAYVATRISGGTSLVPGTVVAMFFVAATISNLVMIPHPLWMTVVGPMAGIGGGAWGLTLARGSATA